jgi:K+-sensing histidine kinase KdpD
VRASSDWLCWAFDKLVDNAVKEAQHVPMRRRIITITVQLVSGEVEIKVANRGRGIPEKVKDQLFKGKVEKLDESDGLGLGLLVTQAIVETYGGVIYLDKSDGTGTEMVIRLPHKTQ